MSDFLDFTAKFDPLDGFIRHVVFDVLPGLLVQTPTAPNQIKAASQVYNVGAQQNSGRIGSPRPVLHGQFRIYPDALSQSWVYYDSNNDQYVRSLLCITQGAAVLKQLYIGDTVIESFSDVTYKVYQPGELVDMFHNNVVTNSEVENLDLKPLTTIAAGVALTYNAAARTITCATPIFQQQVAGVATGYPVPGDRIRVVGTRLNNGDYTVASVSTDFTTITVGEALQNETAASTGAGTSTLTFDSLPTTYSDLFTYNSNGNISGAGSTHIDDAVAYAKLKKAKTVTVTGGTPADGVYTIIQAVVSDTSDSSYLTVTPAPPNFDGSNPSVQSNLYLISDQVGPFRANPSFTSVNRIELDFVFNQGLYSVDNNGGLQTNTVQAMVQYRKAAVTPVSSIDPTVPSPAGPYTSVLETFSAADNTPQRFTRGYNLDPSLTGPIEATVVLLTPLSTTVNSQNAMTWSGLRGFAIAPTGGTPIADAPVYTTNDHWTYPELTVLAFQARVSGQISAALSKKVNGVFSRVLPVYSDGTWTNQETSSISWAFADVCMNPIYGLGKSASELDLVKLQALDVAATARGDYFNGYWDQAGTGWEALQKIARCGRQAPQYDGSVFSMIRDEPRTIRSGMFTNQTAKIGEPEYTFPALDVAQGVNVKYHDPTTFQEKSILCGVDVNSVDLELFGCTSRQQAFNEGNFTLASDKYRRVKIEVTPEMDGFLVGVGDLVTIQNAYTNWGQGAYAVAISADGLTIKVDRDLDWSGGTPVLRLRGSDGSVSSDLVCTEGADASLIVLAAPPPFPIITGSSTQRPTYLQLGTAAGSAVDAIVAGFAPVDEVTGKLSCTVEDLRVHADPGPAPPEDG